MPAASNNISRFYTSIGLLIALNLVIKPLWIFAIDLQVQNIIGTEAYGNYFAIFNLAIVFSFITDFGFTLFINHATSVNPVEYTTQTRAMVFLKIIFSIIYFIIVFSIAWISGIHDWYILLLVVMIQVFTSFYLFFRAILTGLQKFTEGALLSVLDKFLMILICGVFIYFPFVFGGITLLNFLWIQVFALLTAIFVLIFLLGFEKLSVRRFSLWDIDHKLLKTALPFTVLIFLMGVHNRIDGFLLERLHPDGDYEAGIYAAAYRLLDAALMPGNLLIAFLLPFMTKRLANQESITAILLNTRHFLMMIVTGVTVFCLLTASWLQHLLYDHPVEYGARVLMFTILSMAGFTLIQVYGTLLTATGKLKTFIIITSVAVMINLVLNILLIPALGAIGPAIAAIISQTVCGFYLMAFVRKKYMVPIHLRSWIYYIFSGALCVVFLLCGLHYMINMWVLIIAYLILGFTLLYLVIKPGLNRSLLV